MLIHFESQHAQVVIPFIFWLKMTWETIPKQHRRGISPNSVFLLFIPVFNLFWSFMVIPSLSKAIRRWRESIEQKATKRSFGEKTGTALCVFAIILLPVATGIVMPIWVKRMNRQKNIAILKSQGKI